MVFGGMSMWAYFREKCLCSSCCHWFIGCVLISCPDAKERDHMQFHMCCGCCCCCCLHCYWRNIFRCAVELYTRQTGRTVSISCVRSQNGKKITYISIWEANGIEEFDKIEMKKGSQSLECRATRKHTHTPHTNNRCMFELLWQLHDIQLNHMNSDHIDHTICRVHTETRWERTWHLKNVKVTTSKPTTTAYIEANMPYKHCAWSYKRQPHYILNSAPLFLHIFSSSSSAVF